MQRLKIDQDIKPLSEVRTGIADYIKQVRDTKRPVIITQHGKGVAGKEKFEVVKPCPVAVEQAVKEALSRSDLEVFEGDNQTEHGQVAKDCVPDGCRKPQQCQLRVITRPTFAAWLR